MSDNQELNQKKQISEFKKSFYLTHGIKLYIYTPQEKNKKIPLGIFHDSALHALHEHHPKFSNIKSLQNRTRLREFLVYVQVMSYLAHKEGHTKSSIGKFIKRNHATVINSCKMIENGFFSNDKTVVDAYNNTLIKIEEYVGTISENTNGKDNPKPSVDPIWDEARSFIAKR
tara:strand:+ start:456 stop:971 length:516 start_codon:yes stop_codon:yes gene_type:complete